MRKLRRPEWSIRLWGGGDAEQVGAAAAVFEQDQGVDAFEVDGVGVQDVDGDDVFGLGGQELLPRWSAAARAGSAGWPE
ncbi:hypothetical protein ACIBG8_09725 [Nonomuraea sp. NPDC050556]|uniref:hypothetical protein n=1 Tax=Nonomuraea sp. NPDC050556 TaxID=3364369 RepID=UPI00379B5B1F